MSLQTITVAIKAALDALKPATAKCVEYYAGEITAQGVAQEALGNTPAIFLAVEGERLDEELSNVTLSGDGMDAAVSTWRVYCVVEDPRDTKRALIGATGTPGVLALIGAVQGALNRLRFNLVTSPDVLSAAHLRFRDVRPVLFLRGTVVAYAVRFDLVRAVEQVTTDPLAGTVPLSGVDGSINVEPDGDHNPLANTRNEF